jgi:hypothetical protein
MEHLDFILWMLLWPVSLSVCNYIDAKTASLSGKPKIYSKETNFYFAVFIIGIWFFVGYKLFNN